MKLTQKIKLLKKYFSKREDVLIAFVFGSYAKGCEIPESDFDLAIYLKQPSTKSEEEIYSEVSDIVEKNVDLVCLNDAPASLISNIFRTGIPLIVKDKRLYLELYLKSSLEAEDFLHFLEDFWRIKQEAKSLNPEEKDRLIIRFDYLNDELKELTEFKKITFKEYKDDKTKRRNLERWTENIINAIIDIAKIVLASEKKEMPKSYESALFHFGLLAGLDESQSRKFSKFANLRNLLAHEYLEILYEKIQNFIKEFPALYKKIFKFLERYLKT